MSRRAYNFNPGPAALPFEVLQKAKEELIEYRGIGMSIMEISHRSKEYEQLNQETEQLFLELLQAPSGYKVLLLQGGASTQFTMLPMNLLKKDQAACYVQTGSWSNKAISEARLFGETVIAASSKEQSYKRIPSFSEYELPQHAAYLHVTSNETIEGTQFKAFPDTGSVPLIADMSSDIMSRPVDVAKFAMIYAGAQKNLGPSGVTVVLLQEQLLQEMNTDIPTMLRYATHADTNSLYNTPPVYSVYMVNLVLHWIKDQGGLDAVARKNQEKAALIYKQIDESEGFYYGNSEPADRSLMNITFRLRDEELEKKFLAEAAEQGFVGLKGHRSVGGLRASAYNAVPYESCKALHDLMQDFRSRYDA